MIKCIIIDDEQPAINVIERYVKRMPQLTLVGTATDPLDGIAMIKKHKADLVFLDIQMDEMNGIEVMQALDINTKVIFCTAYSEFAVDSYELHAIDYLMKPVPYERFEKAVQRYINMTAADKVPMEEISHDYFFVKGGQKGCMTKIIVDEIDYVEAMKNYVAFHNREGIALAYMRMQEVEAYLPKSQFIRVHKSFIIAMKRVLSLEHGNFHLKGCHKTIPLSPQYRKAFMEQVQSKILL